jgi:hypothetical protein
VFRCRFNALPVICTIMLVNFNLEQASPIGHRRSACLPVFANATISEAEKKQLSK